MVAAQICFGGRKTGLINYSDIIPGSAGQLSTAETFFCFFLSFVLHLIPEIFFQIMQFSYSRIGTAVIFMLTASRLFWFSNNWVLFYFSIIFAVINSITLFFFPPVHILPLNLKILCIKAWKIDPSHQHL